MTQTLNRKPTREEAIKIQAHYRQHPEFFFKHFLGINAWSKQLEIAESVRDNRITTVRSCHAAGKSYIAACIALWYISAYPQSIVVTTAPTWRQVKDILWRNVNTRYAQAKIPLGGDAPNMTGWQVSTNWFAIGVSSKDPDKIQGYHAESGHLLVICDEAAGIEEPIFEGIDAILTGDKCRKLEIGNPTSSSGTFRDNHKPGAPTKKIRISAFDTPNFTANGIRDEQDLIDAIKNKRELTIVADYLISPIWVYERVKKWGVNSPMYKARVLAEFPDVGENNLIPLSWIEAACTDERLEKILGLKLPHPDILQVGEARFEQIEAENDRVRKEKLQEYIALQNTVRGVDVARFGCFDDQTEILTNEGWKLFRDLSMRHRVLTLNPQTMVAEWGPITKIHQYEHHGEMNLLESERLNFCITDNHKLLVKTNPKSDRWALKRYDEIAQEFVFKRTNEWNARSRKYITFTSKKKMPHGGNAIKDWTFSMLDWAEFLGWFVSEGNVYAEKRARGRLRTQVAQYPGVKRDRIRTLLDRMGIAYRETHNQFEISNNVIGRHLIKHCGVGAANKRIPRYIKEGSTAVITAFLESYRLGDGTCRKDGNGVAYGTTSKLLADDVQECLVKIGHAGKVSAASRKGTEFYIDGRRIVRLHDGYTVYQQTTKHDGWAKKSNIKRVRYDGFVYCVTTPHHTIMVRRKGVPMWSGNSDSTVITPRWGDIIGQQLGYHKEDTMQTAGRVWALISNVPTDFTAVDVIGVGGGVVDRLHELQREQEAQGKGQFAVVVGINVADKPTEKPEGLDQMEFANQRAELYWKLRDRFEAGDIYLMPDEDGKSPEDLMDELSSIQYKFLGSKIYIEEKAEMKKRLNGKSPDHADSLMLSTARGHVVQWTTEEPDEPEDDADWEPPGRGDDENSWDESDIGSSSLLGEY